MGVVSEKMGQIITRQLDEHGLVVWFDPERHWEAFATSLELPNAAVERWQGSFLDLRRRAEPHLAPLDSAGDWRERPGRLLVYVPLAPEETADALIDLTAQTDAVLRPGAHSLPRNTRLAVVARQALATTLPPAQLDGIVRQAEAGELSLADLERLAEQGLRGEYPLVSLVFGHTNAPDVALELLGSAARDSEIAARGADSELAALLHAAFDLPVESDATAPILRERLARWLLLAELRATLGADAPRALRSLPLPARGETREALVRLARVWRDRRDLRASYCTAAAEVARQLGPDVFGELGTDALRKVVTFREAEQALQLATARALCAGVPDAERDVLVTEAERRGTGFWSQDDTVTEESATHREIWRILADAGQLLAIGEEIATALKRRKFTAEALAAAYVSGERPWCLLDTTHRRLLRRYHEFEPELHATSVAEEIGAIVAHARTRYDRVLVDLTESFSRVWLASRASVDGVPAQADTFARVVAPFLASSSGEKVAYLLVDALRYEMALELSERRLEGWRTSLSPAAATVPTITKVGMAALIPGAERQLALVSRKGKLGVDVDGQPVDTRAERVKRLTQVAGAGFAECELDDLIPLRPPMKSRLSRPDVRLAFITSGEIDQVGENVNTAMARRMMSQVIDDLRRALAALGDCGFTRVVITADHGYLFAEEINAGDIIAAPGGETIELHRRVWIGRGGQQSPGVLRLTTSDAGLGGDLELAIPASTAVFAAPGGATEYFHGGVSLQELIVPVLELQRVGAVVSTPGASLLWTITPGSRAISTRFCTATISAVSQELLPLVPPRVLVDIRVGDQRIGAPVAATYGFDATTGEVQLRVAEGDPRALEANTITFHLPDDDLPNGEATIFMTDSMTGRELKRLDDIPVKIAI